MGFNVGRTYVALHQTNGGWWVRKVPRLVDRRVKEEKQQWIISGVPAYLRNLVFRNKR